MGVFKKAKRAVKKLTKPVAKVLDKVVPNEIKPFLPYIAAVAPVLGPMGTFGQGIASLGKYKAAGLYGLGALGAELAQEGSEGDFDLLPVLSAAASGFLAAPGTTGVTTAQGLADQGISRSLTPKLFRSEMANRSFLTKAKDLGITGIQGIEQILQAPKTAGGFKATTKALAKAASPTLTTRITQDAVNTAQQALEDYNAELAELERISGEAQIADDNARRSAVIAAMTAGQHSDDVINETLTLLGLDTLLAKDGGVVKMKDGGIMDLGGKEMDLRGGGFVPIGKKERADDVPARLSKNEFVMTADAVRGAGGGDINEGARRMYETMDKLEARA
jgi:hypothetical protein